ncbi:MAG: glycosyltransferase 87 family protein [Longimicrobiales bacterium]
MSRARSFLVLALAAEAGLLALIAAQPDPGALPARYIGLFGAAALVALTAFVLHLRAPLRLRWILATALGLRLLLIPTVPSLSDDVWRYLHDGRAQRAGLSPYRYAPAAAETRVFAGAERPLINHPELPTIYPPAAQLAFAAAPSLLAWKLLIVALDLGVILALARLLGSLGRMPAWAALYAWHPLPIIEVAASGHFEPLAVLPLLLALRAAVRPRPLAAGAWLAAATAAKLFSIPVLPFLARRHARRVLGGFGLVLLLLYLPYLLVSGTAVLGSLGLFAQQWSFNGSIFAMVAALAPPTAARLAVAGAFGVVWIVVWRRRPAPVEAALGILLALLLLAPVVHPWYLLWVLPLAAAALAPRRPGSSMAASLRYGNPPALAVLVWSLTVPLAYVVLGPYRATGEWRLPVAAVVAEYAPVYLVLLAAALTARASGSARSDADREARRPDRTGRAVPALPSDG